jgi:hypothetical protein
MLLGLDPSTDLLAELDKAMALVRFRNENLRKLFVNIGAQQAVCKCGATIYFIRHQNGKLAPYNADAETHFATCPNSKEFRKR